MNKVIVQIDGGHLREIARAANHQYDPDFIEDFANTLIDEDEDLIRILYYDCAPYKGHPLRPISRKPMPNSKSSGWLVDLAARNLMAVRLGVLKWRGWEPNWPPPEDSKFTDDDFHPKFEQKGVDLKIGLDIAICSFEKTVDRIILVSGDTDLIPAMKLARRSGLQIVGVDFREGDVPGSGVGAVAGRRPSSIFA